MPLRTTRWNDREQRSAGFSIPLALVARRMGLLSQKLRHSSGGADPGTHFAWDRFRDEKLIDAGIERVRAAGIKAWQIAFFVLIGYDTTPEQDLYRVMKIKKLGADPFAMPYRKNDPYQKAFARWVNHRPIFNTVEWEDYRSGVKKTNG